MLQQHSLPFNVCKSCRSCYTVSYTKAQTAKRGACTRDGYAQTRSEPEPDSSTQIETRESLPSQSAIQIQTNKYLLVFFVYMYQALSRCQSSIGRAADRKRVSHDTSSKQREVEILSIAIGDAIRYAMIDSNKKGSIAKPEN